MIYIYTVMTGLCIVQANELYVLCPPPNIRMKTDVCITSSCFLFCSFISSPAGCSGRNVVSGHTYWTGWVWGKVKYLPLYLVHLYPATLSFFPEDALKRSPNLIRLRIPSNFWLSRYLFFAGELLFSMTLVSLSALICI